MHEERRVVVPARVQSAPLPTVKMRTACRQRGTGVRIPGMSSRPPLQCLPFFFWFIRSLFVATVGERRRTGTELSPRLQGPIENHRKPNFHHALVGLGLELVPARFPSSTHKHLKKLTPTIPSISYDHEVFFFFFDYCLL